MLASRSQLPPSLTPHTYTPTNRLHITFTSSLTLATPRLRHDCFHRPQDLDCCGPPRPCIRSRVLRRVSGQGDAPPDDHCKTHNAAAFDKTSLHEGRRVLQERSGLLRQGTLLVHTHAVGGTRKEAVPEGTSEVLWCRPPLYGCPWTSVHSVRSLVCAALFLTKITAVCVVLEDIFMNLAMTDRLSLRLCDRFFPMFAFPQRAAVTPETHACQTASSDGEASVRSRCAGPRAANTPSLPTPSLPTLSLPTPTTRTTRKLFHHRNLLWSRSTRRTRSPSSSLRIKGSGAD